MLSSVNTQGFADVAETEEVLVTPDELHAPEYGSAIGECLEDLSVAMALVPLAPPFPGSQQPCSSEVAT